MNFNDKLHKLSILPGSGRWFPPTPGIETAGGDPQHAAQVRNRVVGFLTLHKQKQLYRVLLVSWAKKAAAFFNISRSSRSIRISRCRRRNSSRSEVVSPSRCPSSISCCPVSYTHLDVYKRQVWCCNPEGVNPYREVMYKSLQCQKCYNCVGKCSQKAISINGSTGLILFDRSICKECDTFECVEACYNGALGITGKDYSIDELMHKIERDRRFWGKGGGVTLGGGEVLQQYKFASRLLERCHANYINTAIETSAYAPWSHLQGVLKNTDWVFVDIKCMDSDIHSKVTGVPNRLILENIKRMAAKNRNYRLIPRIPIIPGINDDNKNIFETVEFLKRVNLFEINISVSYTHLVSICEVDFTGFVKSKLSPYAISRCAGAIDARLGSS